MGSKVAVEGRNMDEDALRKERILGEGEQV